jgi:hypothetical protein
MSYIKTNTSLFFEIVINSSELSKEFVISKKVYKLTKYTFLQ